MGFSDIAKRVGNVAMKNSPAILTVIGVTGAVTTAVLTGRASFKAAQVLEKERLHYEAELDREMELKDKVQLTWTLFIPPVASLGLTVAAIIFANRMGSRQAAALAAAYSIAEKGFDEYKNKVAEKIGAKKEEAVRDDIAQDRLNANPVDDRQIIITGNGNVLCMEALTGRYFESDAETLRRAENNINYQIIGNGYASLTEFYNEVGLARTSVSDELGWSSDRPLELDIRAGLAKNDKPCLVVDYRVEPMHNHYKIN